VAVLTGSQWEPTEVLVSVLLEEYLVVNEESETAE